MEILQAQVLDQQSHQLKGKKLLLLNERKQALNEAILDFLQAVELADREQFAAAARALEPAYLNYLYVFGDFESIQTFYALN